MRWAFGLACLTLSLVLKGCRVTENIEATINGPKRLGSFLAIGDWGWDSESHGNLGSKHCQQLVADAMHRELQNLGDVRFVINVGDSFYPDGVRNKSDPQWEEKWRQIYSPEVRGVPWYSVYGNHDYHADPCACSDDLEHCAQINGDITDLNFFFMPDFSWFKEHSDLDTEVIALDTNYYNWLNLTCPHTDCPDLCRANLRRRGEAALELFFRRVERSQASNLVVPRLHSETQRERASEKPQGSCRLRQL
ncbi:unnamed protein product [Effrenium voratum]|uniref:Calcineurin-like phosphoesterase domain-containing protein n=1 Tax=Effrenium voratum TaxID=2562239 RepID=A0AA36N3Z3_9DINO|nr:unnamed protein product [Effrenium voratum]CAJ1456372.1 unnamed protein product [Effrenium voratum]